MDDAVQAKLEVYRDALERILKSVREVECVYDCTPYGLDFEAIREHVAGCPMAIAGEALRERGDALS